MTTRINPHRPAQASSTDLKHPSDHIKRIVLSTAQIAVEAHPAKWLRTPNKPKSRVLVIAHSVRGALDDHALQTIAAAAILADADAAVLVLILGELNDDLNQNNVSDNNLSHNNLKHAGADEVIVLPTLDFQTFQPDIELASVLAVIESLQPSRIFMPDNLLGDGDLGRRLIAHTVIYSNTVGALSAATHVVELDTKHVASYQAGGRVLAKSELPEIILLAPNAANAELPFIAKATRINAPTINHTTSQYQDLGLQTSVAEDMALEEADFIVSAGNGVQNLATLASLANMLNAAVGASRVVVDDGKLPRDQQIGATGKTVTASTYIAIGISGAVQHLQGIKDCRHVIAINKDASAPIIKRANLSIIGDAEAVMQALMTEIEKEKEKVVVA